MILHLIDDEKFVESLIFSMELAYPSKNKYLVGLNGENAYSEHLTALNSVFLAQYESTEYEEFLGDLSSYEMVIIHFLNNNKIKIIEKAPPNTSFVWNIWGSDLYTLLSKIEYPVYSKLTENYLIKRASKNAFAYLSRKTILYKYYSHCKKKNRRKSLKSILNSFKFYSTIIPEEKEIVEKYLEIEAKHICFTYSFIENIFSDVNLYSFSDLGQDILLGNSGTPTNNHVDLIKILSSQDLGHRKVNVFLSYGDRNYIDYIIDFGRNKLKDKFNPITDFLPFNEFILKLQHNRICIMGHYRQQAGGTILLMLWLGAKVYLSCRNPFYKFCINRGIKVLSIEQEFFHNNHNLFDNLTSQERLKNRIEILKYFGQDNILNRNKEFVKTITKTF